VNKIALGGLLAMAAAGVWLVAAPFAERYQAAGAPWTGAAWTDVAVGAIVAAVAMTGFFAALAGRVRELYAGAARDSGSGPDQAQ
jgi:cytochrome c oxidase assembly factor CtaG